MVDRDQHSRHSSLREIIVEHQFIGAALKILWRRGITDAEILKSEFDGYGYDLVVTWGDIVRHVQLKSGLTIKPVSVSMLLAGKPSGCVIFIQINDQLDLESFFWFGNEMPGEPLPNISKLRISKRQTANSRGEKPARVGHRTIPVSRFKKIAALEPLLDSLLGEGVNVRAYGEHHPRPDG